MPGVKRDVMRAVGRLTAALAGAFPPPHRLEVLVVPNPAVVKEGGFGFGVFHTAAGIGHARYDARIVIAAGLAEITQADAGATRTEGVRAVVETLLHEWVHYEQFRDGRPITERGVQVRARNLYGRFARRV
jgi:hypothetical protein